jgi:CubicO group peptidase (beta-lactamase class C family)
MKNKPLVASIVLNVVTVLCLIVVTGIPSKVRTAASLYREDGIRGVYGRAREYIPWAGPNVRWETAPPEAVGMNGQRLTALQDSLAARDTQALLVARDGRIVLEWYAPGFDANVQQGLAAMAKGVVGGPILLAAVSDTLVALDDVAAKYIPVWRGDTERSAITMRHLASHSSGIEEVDFRREQSAWKAEYLDNPERRFRMALETAPILFPPGTRTSYSGVGFYALAYALGAALHQSDRPTDIRSFLRDRIMRPIGVPTEAWSLSYGESYEVDGMVLRAIGSGASLTPRAVARVAELYLRGGEWDGRQVIRADLVNQALTYSQSPAEPDPTWTEPVPGFGWWANSEGFFGSLPRDAAVAQGADDQLLLVVPSLHLLALRLGGAIGQPGEDVWTVADEHFLTPVIEAIEGTRRTPAK